MWFVLVGLAVAVVALLATGRAPARRWNVVVMVPDTVRGDHVSINGYARQTTPALDALARDGTNFSQAITVAPQTWQSYSSILSGLYPPHHGVRFIFDRSMSPDIATLGTVLKANGYETATFDGNSFLKGMTGGNGFDDNIRVDTKRVADTSPDAQVVLMDQILEWIDGRKEPFLAFIRDVGGHWPYETNEWTAQFDPCDGHDHSFNEGDYGQLVGEPGHGLTLKDAAANHRMFFPPALPDRERDHVIAHYDAKLRFGDTQFGRMIEHLRDKGLLDRTIIVVTADHGESFGEHGYRQHGPRVDEPAMHVPLVIWLPPSHPMRHAGGNVDTLVRVVDIFPTILDLVGLPIPSGLDGISLVPAIRGKLLPPLWAYGESGRDYVGVDPERFFPGVEGKHRMIRTADWKLVYILRPEGPEYRLYDLRNDPGELTNVAAQHPDRVAELREKLEPFLAVDDHRDKRPDRPLTAGELEQLRQLGYAD